MNLVREKIEEALNDAYEDLRHSAVGSKEYEAAMKNCETMSKLYFQQYETEAKETHREEEDRIRAEELKLKKEESERTKKRDKKEFWMKVGNIALHSTEIAVGVGMTIFGVMATMEQTRYICEYEEENSINSRSWGLSSKISDMTVRKKWF